MRSPGNDRQAGIERSRGSLPDALPRTRPIVPRREAGDGDGLAPVEADQSRINQIVHLHHAWQGVDVDAGMAPDLGAGRGRKHSLDVDALRCELEAQRL